MLIRRGLCLFFTLWYALVVVTNTTDLAQTLGFLPASFGWVSGNHALIIGPLGDSGPLWTVATGVYVLGMLWELATASVFARAVWHDTRASSRTAFAVALAFWAVFLLMDEASLAYRFGSLMTTHLVIFTVHLAAFVGVELLAEPD